MIDLGDYKLILASGSPRRKELLGSFRVPFEVIPSAKEEKYPDDLLNKDVPEFLAKNKAHDVFEKHEEKSIVIGADTVVVLNNEILGKPKSPTQAFKMLKNLSGNFHDVYTGVCLLSNRNEVKFTCYTRIHFAELSDREINSYIETYQPFDKAGGYGIQDWIGREKVLKIEGDYFNVMGFPVSRTFVELSNF